MVVLVHLNELICKLYPLEITVLILKLQLDILNYRDWLLPYNDALHFNRFYELIPIMLSDVRPLWPCSWLSVEHLLNHVLAQR